MHTSEQLATNTLHNNLRFDTLIEWHTELRKVLYLRLQFYNEGDKPGLAKWRDA